MHNWYSTHSTHLYSRWNVLVTLGATLEQGKNVTPFLWWEHLWLLPFSSVFCSVVVIRFPVVFPMFSHEFWGTASFAAVPHAASKTMKTTLSQPAMRAAWKSQGYKRTCQLQILLRVWKWHSVCCSYWMRKAGAFFGKDGRTILTQKKSLEHTLSRTISLHFTSTFFSSVFNAERHFRLDAARPSLHRGIHAATTMDL